MSVLFAAVSLACTVACRVLLPALSLPVLLPPCPGAYPCLPGSSFSSCWPRFLPSVCYLYDICLGILIQMSLCLALLRCLPSLPPSLSCCRLPSLSRCTSLGRPAACLFAPSCWPRFLSSVHVSMLFIFEVCLGIMIDTDVVII